MIRRHVVAVVALTLMSACGGGSPVQPGPPATSTPVPTPTPTPTPTPQPTPTPAPGPTLGIARILAFGDSITAGYIETDPTATSRFFLSPRNVDPVAAYPSQLEKSLRARYPAQEITVSNAGLSGEWAQDGQFRLPGLVRSAQPEVVLILEGGNDLTAERLAGIERAVVALENMLRDARADGAIVVLGGLPPRRPGSPRGEWPELVPEFNASVRRLAERQNVGYVDIEAAFGGDYGLLSVDGLHPNAAGYLRMAEAFRDFVVGQFERGGPVASRQSPVASRQ
jgi:lysophospholipase L1-like esterase